MTYDQPQHRAKISPEALSIGAVSKATDIPVSTLRTWERRYGWPVPLRTQSGHRKYSATIVPHLRLIQTALDEGHKPRDVVSLPLDDLHTLLGPPAAASAPAKEKDAAEEVAPHHADPMLQAVVRQWLETTLTLDRPAMMRNLERSWFRLDPISFLQDLVTPFLAEVGMAWYRGEMAVLHEQFASECLRSFLCSQWQPLSQRAGGRPVVCATLPGEYHALGLHMVAVIMAMAGCEVVFLGCDTPTEAIAKAVITHRSCDVLLSVSAASKAREGLVREQIGRLRAQLPPKVELVLGGSGAPTLPGLTSFHSLWDLHQWSKARCL